MLHSVRRRYIVSTAAVYLLLGSAWIVLSDHWGAGLAQGTAGISLQTGKGLLFVVVTSVLLMVALGSVPPRDAELDRRRTGGVGAVVFVFSLLAALSVAAGTLAYRRLEVELVADLREDLQTRASLNAGQIESWIEDRRRDVRAIAANPLAVERVTRWLSAGDADDRRQLERWLASDREGMLFDHVELVDAAGGHLLGSVDAEGNREHQRSAIVRAARTGKLVFLDLHRDAPGESMHMALAAPMHATGSDAVLAVLFVEVDAEQHLLPLVSREPGLTRTGESMLFRRGADGAVEFLTALWSESGTGPGPLSLSDPSLPARRMLDGERGMLEGTDYRGTPVFAFGMPVAGTTWTVAAQIDRAEALAGLQRGAWIMGVLMTAVAVVCFLLALHYWQRQRMFNAYALVDETRAREASERRFREVFENAAVGMAIVARDGRFRQVNPMLCAITGYAAEELADKTILDLLPAQEREDTKGRLLAELRSTGHLRLEQRIVRKDGTVRWVTLHSSRVGTGAETYFVGAVKDVTERHDAEDALRLSEERFELAMRGARDGIWDWDVRSGATYFSPSWTSMLGYADGELDCRIETFERLLHPDDKRRLGDGAESVRASSGALEFECRMRHKDGHYVDVLSRAYPVFADDGALQRLVGTHVNISERKAVEAALRERANLHEYLGRIADTLPGALYTFRRSADGRMSFPYAAPQFERMFGVVPADVADDAAPAFAYVHADDLHGLLASIEASRRSGALWHGEFRVQLPQQGQRWIEGRSTPLTTASGDTVWHGFLHDITARKEQEARLRQASVVLASTREGVVVTDVAGCILSVNDAFCQITGYDKAELLGRNPRILASGRQDKDFYRALWRGVERHGYWQGEIWNRRKNGEIYPEWLTISAVKDDAGKTINYVGTFSDITEHVQAEQRLRQLSLAVQQSPNSIVITDVEGRIEFVNEMAVRNSGYSEAELLGQNPRVLQSGGTSQQTYSELWNALLSGRTWRGELHNRRKDGSIYVERASISPVRQPDGRVTHYVAIKSDVTEERRQADELEQHRHHLEELVDARTQELSLAKQQAEVANAAKSAFLATMSHEIRTPMNGIIGMVEVLSRGDMSKHQAELIGTVRQSAQTLLRIIDDILDFSKIEAGHLQLEQRPICLADTVEGLCASMNTTAVGKGVELFVFVDPTIPEAVLGDDLRVRQVLYNLIGNAIKFSAGRPNTAGRVRVRVEMVSRAPEPPRIRFTVSDNGIGMSTETIANLFTAFTQAEVSTTRRFGGTGLGLAICKRLVGAMRGSIDVSSVPDAGSTFVVTLSFGMAARQPLRTLPDVSGIECFILAGAHYDAEDLRIYLEAGGARAQCMAASDELIRVAAHAHRPVIIRSAEPGDSKNDALSAALAASAPEARQLLITAGRRRSVRVDTPDLVTLDVGRLRRQAILHAVAAAAGRVSVPVVSPGPSDDEADCEVATQSVGCARADGQLILVAEDDEINQKVILEQLRLLGLTAEVAGNGAEALHLWRQNEYALLLTDLHMPEMDGYALTRTIRAEETGRRMPILALTANALRGEASHALDIGMDAYLVKPVQLDLLKAALDEWMPVAVDRPDPQRAITARTEAAQAAPTNEVDLSVLRKLVGTDPDVLRELLTEYQASLRKHAADIGAGLAAGELGKVGALAHRLKSSSRSVGALRLGDLCATVENLCKVGDAEALAALTHEFRHAVSAAEAEVARHILRATERS